MPKLLVVYEVSRTAEEDEEEASVAELSTVTLYAPFKRGAFFSSDTSVTIVDSAAGEAVAMPKREAGSKDVRTSGSGGTTYVCVGSAAIVPPGVNKHSEAPE